MFSSMDKRRAQHRLTDPEIAALRNYLDARGHAAACEAIGIVRTTAYRAMAHDTIARGTSALIRMALALESAQERTP
jgi:hypothetical protein